MGYGCQLSDECSSTRLGSAHGKAYHVASNPDIGLGAGLQGHSDSENPDQQGCDQAVNRAKAILSETEQEGTHRSGEIDYHDQYD